MLKKTALLALSGGLVLSGIAIGTQNEESTASGKPDWAGQGNEKVHNVIYMIPDGYNASYATNYRWFKGEESSFDPFVKGLMQTYSADTEVTDSAAAGTAMATGEKTNNGMVGVTPDGEQVDSILDAAEEAGKSTGLVATSTITHATPAVFGSSVESRGNEAGIAPQYFENGVDVLLGGGRDYFLPESEGGKQPELNLIESAEADGYEYVTNSDELTSAKSGKLLGLFADDAMAPELERGETDQPSLADMTGAALNALEQDKDGFFLMVEGSQIDWAGHAHDAAWAMNDTKAFDEAVAAAIEYAKKDKNTLVVVAGDHETGGMSVGSNGEYDLNIDVLHDVKATGDTMAAELNEDRSNAREIVKEYANIELTEEEAALIEETDNAAMAINEVISDRALVGWTTSAHTGVDVPVYAYGAQAHKFSGLLNNTDLPKLMGEAMKIDF
ncbi:alkaline phosphatase [Jeotgalibacillus haloalkalitolerans]|uniref:Alkaline phosphatase n=1 Tax=Jeotgalibacillus haloalkalitolerans TaxID=3104292 RepID=A0ABU5KJH7_9BACL|nr:alkaline phosphatase [Jeotgalibacillus sp. HH7-29]MDZ5711412.1 alkaline phosphatase [Jeotgalibacillus sp. HH7-29]